jgi:hypothetical protein
MTCDELAMALIRVLDDRLVENAQLKNTRVNHVIGFHWEMEYASRVLLAGQSFKMKSDPIIDMGGYTGKLWFRFEYDFIGNPITLFKDTGYLLGVGGYSTWNGPWQETGQQFNRWETGVSRNLCTRQLAAYAFSTQFYISDFPGIDQTMLMNKMGDRPIQAHEEFTWEGYDLKTADTRYLEYLKAL